MRHKKVTLLLFALMTFVSFDLLAKPMSNPTALQHITKLVPVQVGLAPYSSLTSFSDMFKLGMEHVKEGTGHLLFLFTLLLPATLIVIRNKWGQFGGIKYGLIRILKIVIAFTIGHSITLLTGVIGRIHFPIELIEVIVAASIFISAIHAFKPLFPGKEIYIAAGFGLIHGMALAETVVDLDLQYRHLALSALGFNIGVELMQLIIIAITLPWLIILSKNNTYTGLRIGVALVAATTSIAWVSEWLYGGPNIMSQFVNWASNHHQWTIILLILAAIVSNFVHTKHAVPIGGNRRQINQ